MARPSFRMEWEAHEYEHKHRSQDWFWAVGIISVSIAVAAVIFGNVILGILILVGAFSLTIFANRPPSIQHVILDESGITRGKIHYPFQTLESFWIDSQHSHKKIILKSEKTFMPLIVIPIGEGVDMDQIHDILIQFLEEEYHSLPFVERILEYLGF